MAVFVIPQYKFTKYLVIEGQLLIFYVLVILVMLNLHILRSDKNVINEWSSVQLHTL